jgi:alginate O-acetyltransferase complex protein AlgI
MLFNSFSFLVFFPLVTVIYFLLPHRFRWIHLLAASCYFYMAFVPVYILILAGTIIIDYVAGIAIENAPEKRKKTYLIISLISNIGVLAVFKYYNFLNENLTELLGIFNVQNQIPYLSILLPIGLSFHTFQAMSYTIEVYNGNQKAERHFGIYSLYVMFYPQLVAGPIERPQNILPQLHEKKEFNYGLVTSGLKLMAWGLIKKMIIADRLAYMVDIVYNNPQEHQGLPLILASIFFAFQIYCDFSGYSDIAIGAARVMGIHLMKNFNYPYFSKSISEFWGRWHISLSTWFRDYLYIPLGGNRVSIPRWYINILIVFIISGIWHGANWTFIMWGALHGIMLVSEHVVRRFKKSMNIHFSMPAPLNILITFIIVTLAWVFFRANSIEDANYILSHLHKGILQDFSLIIENLRTGNGIINNTSLAKWTSHRNDYIWSASVILLLITHRIRQQQKKLVFNDQWLPCKHSICHLPGYYF